MKLTDKSKIAFEDWLSDYHIKNLSGHLGRFGYLPEEMQYGLMLKYIREERGVLICVYRNASGYLWGIELNEGGTNLGDCGYSGNCLDSGTFKTYNDAMNNIIGLQLKFSLKEFRKKSKPFHWGNYAEWMINRNEK